MLTFDLVLGKCGVSLSAGEGLDLKLVIGRAVVSVVQIQTLTAVRCGTASVQFMIESIYVLT